MAADDSIGVVDQDAAGTPNAVAVDTSEIVQDAGTTVQRQRIVVADPSVPDRFVGVTSVEMAFDWFER